MMLTAVCTPCAAEIIHIIIIQSHLTICISQAILVCTGAIEELTCISVTFVPQAAHVLPLRAAAHLAVGYCPAVGFIPLSPFLSRLWCCVSQERCLIHGSIARMVQMPTLAVQIQEHAANWLCWRGLGHQPDSREKPRLERLSPGKLLSA